MADERKPLGGYTILITRAKDQSYEIAGRIREFGGTAVCFPMIEIAGPDSWEACDTSIVNIKKYDGIIFTSANAVRGFVGRIENNFPHVKDILKRRSIYAVGKKTKEVLSQYGIPAGAVPGEYSADALVEMITKPGAEGKTFLLPAGNLTRDIIDNGLTEAGAVVERARVYTTRKPDTVDTVRLQQLITERAVDVVTFFSPSGAHHFFELIDPALVGDIPVAVIGKTTYDAVAGYGIYPKIRPDEATGEELVHSISEYIRNVRKAKHE